MFGIIEKLHRVWEAVLRTEQTQHLIIKKLDKMANEIEDLKAEVAQGITVEESAITLIVNLADKLDQVTDLSQLTQITADLRAERQKLADAITANTPAQPVNS